MFTILKTRALLKKHWKEDRGNFKSWNALKAVLLIAGGLFVNSADAQISVLSTGGTTIPTTYTTVNAAFTAINSGTHQGAIAISVVGNTNEPATPVPLLASGGTSSYTSITIKPSGGSFTINSDAAPSTNRGIIELAGADNITIDGDDPGTTGLQNLSILAAPVTTSGIACIRLSSNSTSGTDGATNIIIKNCILTGSRSSATSSTTNYGIQFSNGTSTSSSSTGAYSNANVLIQNNLITRCYYGVSAIGSSSSYLNTNVSILNNIMGSAVSANNIGYRGIMVSYTSATAGSSSAIVSGNDIRVGDYGTSGYSATIAGIEVGTTNAGCLVNGNNIHDVSQPSTSGYGAQGLYLSSSTSNAGIRITNNFVRDCKMYVYQTSVTSTYIPVGVFITGGVTNLVFNNNTVLMNDQLFSSTTYSSACVSVTSSSVTFSQFLNNILVNNHPSSGAYGFYTSATGNISGAAVNNNDYFVNSAARVGYYNGANQITFANWQTATTKDGLSISENPVFTSATDLHIPNGTTTLLESGGANVATTGVNTDFDNQTRPGTSSYGFGTAPDIGADEFNGIIVYTCVTPTPGTTLASANNICSGTSVTFSMANATTGTGVNYAWESSADNVFYVPISGATATTYTTVPTAPLYYRCKVTCANGPVSTYSTSVLLSFANTVSSATGSVRCGTGTLNLTASGTSGTILNWYAAATGGASLGSGSLFTTPVISNTTTFYVGAETLANGLGTVGTGVVNNGTSGYPTPYGNYYGSSHDQYLITAAELNAAGLTAGNLTSLAFDLASGYSYAALQNYKIQVAPTSATAMTTSLITTGFVTVVPAATYTPPTTTGFATIPFTTPFSWDGASNIVVDISFSNCSVCNGTTACTTSYTNNGVVNQTATSYVSSLSVYADNNCTVNTMAPAGSPSTYTYSQRPNMRFAGVKVCSSQRTPVVATVNVAPALAITANQTICNNAITPLNVTSSLSNYNAYVWSPATDLYTNAAATTPYVAGSNASAVYLKSATASAAVYTVSATNSVSLCAQVAKDTMVVLPGAVTATGSPSYACMSGTASFTLSPATGYGNGAFQWQISSDNVLFTDVLGATAISYTTPATTATRYYRATLKNSANAVCLNSISDTIKVYNPLVTTTIPGAHCGPGTVTLGANSIDGNLKWYTGATGGTSVAGGISYTTPSLATTTTYYVEAESYGSVTGVVGAGGTTLSGSGQSPFAQFYEGARTQYLITPADLNAAGIYAGNITSLSFNVSTKSSTFPYTNYSISMGSTTVSSLTAILTPTLTTVYGPTSYSSVLGANTFNFTAPYAWDGVSNLLVDICFSNDPTSSGTFWSSNDQVTATTKSYNATYGMYADNSALCGATTGGTTTSATLLPVITFAEAGCVSPRLPVVASINPIPTAGVSPIGTTTICAGNTATLTGSGGTAYQWRNATGNIAGATAGTYPAGTSGSYRVVAITAATGCSDTSAAVNVVVNALPVVNLGNDTTFCSGNSLILNAGTNGNSYLWDNATTSQTRVVTTTGNYYVKVTNTNNCIGRDTILVTVNPTPIVNLGVDTFLCVGASFTMNAGNAGAAYLWDDNSTAQTRMVTTSGAYSVKVTNSYSCVGRDTVVATYLSNPVVNLGSDIDACIGNTVTLNAGNPGNTYLWDNGSTQQTRNVTTSGSYYVKVTNAGNCKGYDTVGVNVHVLPVVNLGNDTTICHGSHVVLNAQNAGDTYLWNDNSTGQMLSVNTTGNYSVNVTDFYHCVGTDNINVFVKPLPSGIINAVHGDTATYTFNVLSPAFVTNYTWDFGDNSPTAFGALVHHRYATNGQYLVSVMLAGECSDSAVSSRTVEVYDVVGGSTGITQVSNSKDLKLYPNPAKDVVVVENLGGLNLKQILVYNVIGQKVYDEKAESSMKHKIDISGLISGIYTVRIETSGGTVIRKFEVLK